uniref:Uncharacterized protein n=1 Tax=Polytomella parva TaxID=51329 RepID=A0A7S0VA47_9CHLO|mmetsp:Transcript_31324/g.56848  ORF Transcript_31324/g.56848 Transcript_31324/m.56848 type:complete len:848 (+) Transcript_31324:151-2694(+)
MLPRSIRSLANLGLKCSQSSNDVSLLRNTARAYSSKNTSVRVFDPNSPEDNIAIRNAPQKVLQLIGDPRSGVADDVTTNPFGEITVEMIWHQLNNESYWYRYEFAGQATEQSHRDSRLSDYTKNLIYLLRAKDPKRWTIDLLAKKFHIRKQRVLAILAHKEVEAHKIESGKQLKGPLSAYGMKVRLDDLRFLSLNNSGNGWEDPIEVRAAAAAAAGAKDTSTAAPTAATTAEDIFVVAPRVAAATRQFQAQLIDALAPYGYDFDRFSADILADLARTKDLAIKVFGEEDALKTPPSAASDAASDALADEVEGGESQQQGPAFFFVEWEKRVNAALGALRPFLTGPVFAAEAKAARLTAELKQKAVAAAAASSNKDSEEVKALAADLQAIADDPTVFKGFLGLPARVRAQVMSAVPEVAIALNAMGEDLRRVQSDDDYAGRLVEVAAQKALEAEEKKKEEKQKEKEKENGEGTTTSNANDNANDTTQVLSDPVCQLDVDVFGFEAFSLKQREELVAAARALSAALRDVHSLAEVAGVKGGAAGGSAGSKSPVSTERVRALQALAEQYRSADVMAEGASVPGSGFMNARPVYEAHELDKAIEVLKEIDPESESKLEQMSAMYKLLSSRYEDEQEAGIQMRQNLLKLAAVKLKEEGGGGGGSGNENENEIENVEDKKFPDLERCNWDFMAAYIDTTIANRVFHRGSGERVVHRTATYPAFEGYPLSDIDTVTEGEVSRRNREAAVQTEDLLYQEFHRKILFNLGMIGEQLHEPQDGEIKPNLRSLLDKPMVVYDIDSASGETVYPPRYVAQVDGTHRPLTDQEKAYQVKRQPSMRIPYLMPMTQRRDNLV